jgi:hypothetical protein
MRVTYVRLALGFWKVETGFSGVWVEVERCLVFSQAYYAISRFGRKKTSIETVHICSYRLEHLLALQRMRNFLPIPLDASAL